MLRSLRFHFHVGHENKGESSYQKRLKSAPVKDYSKRLTQRKHAKNDYSYRQALIE